MKDNLPKRKYIFRFNVKPKKESYVVNRNQHFQSADDKYRLLTEQMERKIKEWKN